MRRLLMTTALFATLAQGALAQSPQFRPLDPSMTVAPAAPVATPSPVPAPAMTAPAPMGTTMTTTTTTVRTSRSGEVIDSIGSGAIPALPLEMTRAGNVAYISGGIGDEELEQLKAQEAMYNLRLNITGNYGQYLSGVTLNLKDATGASLVSVVEAGPYVYMQVPAGKYTVDITGPGGAAKQLHVNVPTSGGVKQQIRLPNPA